MSYKADRAAGARLAAQAQRAKWRQAISERGASKRGKRGRRGDGLPAYRPGMGRVNPGAQ